MIFDNLILNNINWNKLNASFKNKKVPNAYIFFGKEGIGKEAHAIEFAALLNCKRPMKEGFPCGDCRSCFRIKSFTHEEIYFILPLPAVKNNKASSKELKLDTSTIEELNENYKAKKENPYHKIRIKNANTIPIRSIRSLKKKLYYTKSDENWSVVVILDAEKLCTPKAESANSLLKILEEPPERTLFILTTSKINLLISTILSRCQKLYFQDLSTIQLEKKLKKQKINLDIEKAELELCDGSMSKLLENIKYDRLDKFKKLADLFYSHELKNIEKFLVYINKISKKEKKEINLYMDFLKISTRDLWVLSKSNSDSILQFKFLFEFYNKKLKLFPYADWNSIINLLDSCILDISRNINLSLCIYSLLIITQSSLKENKTNRYKTELIKDI